MNTNIDELIDIKSVSVNQSLSKRERIAEYNRQIKNPNLFRCGEFTIIAHFSGDGVSMEQRIENLLT